MQSQKKKKKIQEFVASFFLECMEAHGRTFYLSFTFEAPLF